MAAIDINEASPQCFDSGGVFTITDASNTYTVYSIEPGTFAVEPGGYAKKKWRRGMVQQKPLLGEEQYSLVKFRAKVGRISESDGLRALAETIDSATGTHAEFTIASKVPFYPGATTGSIQTFTGASFVGPPKITPGLEFDLFEVEFECRDKFGTTTTY